MEADSLNFMFSVLLEGEVGIAGEEQARYASALKRKNTPGRFHTASDSLRAQLQEMQCNAVKGNI